MSWQCEMVLITRHLIDDVDSTNYTYSDSRLEQTVLVSAQLVLNELTFTNTYTINVEGESISPDPTENTKDNDFINIVCLRAACLVLGNELKTKGFSAISVVDGPSTINMTNYTKGLKDLYNNMLSRYDNAKQMFQMNGTVGQAILTPYSPGGDYVSRSDYRGIY